MALSKKEASRIAALINSIQVSEVMENEARKSANLKARYMWSIKTMKEAIALFDEFGIEVVNYQQYVEMLPRYVAEYARMSVE